MVPFPGNPKDNNHTPGVLPLSWWNMAEFMANKVSNCLGPRFKRFDVSTTSRSPAFDLQMVSRVTEVTGTESGSFYNGLARFNPSKGTMVAELDVHSDSWFFQGSSNDR